MNKKILLIISIIFLSLILSILAASNVYQINKNLVDVEVSFINDVTKRDLLATQSVRDSLLLGDLVRAYTSLKNLEKDLFFEGFEIWHGDKVVETSKPYDESLFFRVEHSVYYDFSSKNSSWGKIVFWHSKMPLTKMREMAISRFQKIMSVVAVVYSVFVLGTIAFLLINTAYIREVLKSYFENNEVKKAPLGRGLLWKPLLTTLEQSSIRYEKLRSENEKRLRHEALAKQARQVAHDIRSPLAALTSMLENSSSSPDFEILSKAACRIRSIASALLNGPFEKNKEPVVLSQLCRRIFLEKKVEYKSRKSIVFSFKEQTNSHIEVVVDDFERVLSNLLNNAVEAIAGSGAIDLVVFEEGGFVKLTITDTGKGMSPELLSRLGHGHFTDKLTGHGLGISYSFEVIQNNSGTLSFFSKQGQGTTVEIAFKSFFSPTPSNIVLLENDPLVQLIWRTNACKKGIQIHIFSDPAEMLKSLTQFSLNTFFYFDLNLNHEVKGFDIARKVFEAGYKNIFMTTGDETFDYHIFPFLKGKVDKKFPW